MKKHEVIAPNTLAFNDECSALGRACAQARMRLDERGPELYREAFNSYQGPKKFPQYFARKWLSLRLSAVKRGMQVDSSVTPEFLERITDVHCPVTHESLDTKGKSPQNPSVDRLVNEVSYRAGNICVLSMRTNRAKGELSFEKVARFAELGKPAAGLEAVEWMRLASLMYGAWARAYKQADPYLLPLAAIPGPGMFMSTSQVVQLLLTQHLKIGARHEDATSRWLEMTHQSGCSEEVFIDLRNSLTRALTEEEHIGNAWLHGEVFEAFVHWYQACREVVVHEVEGLMQKYQGHLSPQVASTDWSIASRHLH